MSKNNEFFGKGKETIGEKIWDWENFQTTEGYPVSDKLMDWVIGQDNALKEAKLCIDEWVHKLEWIQKEDWWKDFDNPEKLKPPPKESLPPGPFLMLLGDPGTGKSLIGRALSIYMTDLYKEKNIKLYDVLSWPNKIIPSEPKVSVHPSPEGKKKVKQISTKVAKKGRFTRWGFKAIFMLMIGIGLFILSYVAISGTLDWINNIVWDPWFGTRVQEAFNNNFLQYVIQACMMGNIQVIMAGVMALSMGGMLYFFGRMSGGFGNSSKGIGGASNTSAPKIIVDNSSGRAPFIDATGHGSSQLFGSIAWDPYQTGDLGTPEHQRVSAGDVHRANMGVLYIDEIKNLTGAEAITLLTILEDGQMPIALRSQSHGGDTAAMAVSTEPVPALVFLVVAGNLDSVCQIHPALMDRIYGYGKIVRMKNDMPNSVENRRKLVQFISQEAGRFKLPPVSREACIEIINEARKKSGKSDALTTKFRTLITIIKTAGVLAINEKAPTILGKHVKAAICEHCKTIGRQLLENYLEESAKFRELNPNGVLMGQIYGLAVFSEGSEMMGAVLRIKGQMTKQKKSTGGFYNVTGTAKKDAQYIGDSISKTRAVIMKKYKVDISKNYFTHLDFAQSYHVDGPSAGVAMTVLLCSLLEKKKIRQDIAITGEINIDEEGVFEVTAIGGAHEKIEAAQASGFKTVLIPYKNFIHSINPKDYKIKVIGVKNLDDCLKELLV